jgi:hypothetical protein
MDEQEKSVMYHGVFDRVSSMFASGWPNSKIAKKLQKEYNNLEYDDEEYVFFVALLQACLKYANENVKDELMSRAGDVLKKIKEAGSGGGVV